MYTVSAASVLVIYVATILENIIVVCGAVHHSVEFCVLIMSGKIKIKKNWNQENWNKINLEIRKLKSEKLKSGKLCFGNEKNT